MKTFDKEYYREYFATHKTQRQRIIRRYLKRHRKEMNEKGKHYYRQNRETVLARFKKPTVSRLWLHQREM